MDVSVITTPQDELGESPVWSAGEGALYWADLPAGLLHRLVPETGETACWELGEPIGW